MSTSHFIAFAASLGLLAACQQQTQQDTAKQPIASSGPVAPAGPQCYAYSAGKDTVRLTLQTTQPTVTGQLAYRYFEKDRNQGTLSGVMRGDTLLADYTFQSEGRESAREVAFVRRGDGFVEGYGAVAERAGKTVFTQPRTLQFNTKNTLRPVACP